MTRITVKLTEASLAEAVSWLTTTFKGDWTEGFTTRVLDGETTNYLLSCMFTDEQAALVADHFGGGAFPGAVSVVDGVIHVGETAIASVEFVEAVPLTNDAGEPYTDAAGRQYYQ